MKTRVRRGFTLPEVLVTVTVVAVLAAVVVPAVTQYVGKGDAPATAQDLNELRNAITAYMADVRSLPDSLGDLTHSSATTWKGPYTTAQLTSGAYYSQGLRVNIGPTLSQTQWSGYLVAAISTLGGTCKDLWALDKVVDGSSIDGTNASTAAKRGLLTWGDSTSTAVNHCDQDYASGSTTNISAEQGTTFAGTGTTGAYIKLMATGK